MGNKTWVRVIYFHTRPRVDGKDTHWFGYRLGVITAGPTGMYDYKRGSEEEMNRLLLA